MKAALPAVAALAAVIATTAFAGDEEPNGRSTSPAAKPSWEFAITAYPTVVRDGENCTSAIAAADRSPLHLEARHNYGSIGARPAFVGWTFYEVAAVAIDSRTRVATPGAVVQCGAFKLGESE